MIALGDYDALTAGVEYGGLRSKQEINLLICFLIENLDEPLSKSQMNELLQKEGLANYFEVSQAVDELIAAGKISVQAGDGRQLLCAMQSVSAATRLLESELPRTVREKALNAAISMQIRAKRLKENTIEVEKLENGEVSLDDSLKLFEEAAGLVKGAQKLLDNAEQRVKKLSVSSDGEISVEDFSKEDEDD